MVLNEIYLIFVILEVFKMLTNSIYSVICKNNYGNLHL